MGSDWYDFFSATAAAIPVPKEALRKPFKLRGFKLMTVHHECFDEELQKHFIEYHDAMICLRDTPMPTPSIEVIGPYEIREHKVVCARMKHLDTFMPADTRDRLINAFEAYTGHKPDVVPGFWTLSSTDSSSVELGTTWSLGDYRIASGDCGELFFSVQ
ncbi:hypothetical protein EC991_009612 [Linnemannia zychae]|nr:hypothetical protein EC991_009612 [Linnemannia zychae]